MPRKSLHGRTCGVSCDGGRARASQPSRRSSALQPNLCSQNTAPKPLSPRRYPRSTRPGWPRYSRPADRCIPGSAGR
ncbi:hypothetical protein XarbCFBP6827_13760 [Xanthomonas arboricola]|nr:hypothetical protein XarbCFBP6827_13760 [Xanthomonas arboricola]